MLHRHQSQRHARITRARGFTLVEILCVIVILGIASALIIPQIGTRDDLKTASAARLVIADLMYAQNLAISKQRKHYIQFTGQQYALLTRTTDTDPLSNVTHPVTKENYAVTFNDRAGMEGVRIDSVNLGGPTILGFDDLGCPFAYDGTTFTPLAAAGAIVMKCGDFTLTVTVEPFTGDMSVE
jgi:prepilin-type N-terminal cleavage/methylation domain-containing protein